MRCKGSVLVALLLTVSLVVSSGITAYASEEGTGELTAVSETAEVTEVTEVTEELLAEEAEEIKESEEELIAEEEELEEEGLEESAEDTSEDEESATKAAEGVEEFEKIASAGDIMAVINLIDSCPVYLDADTSSSIITHIEIGNTVFVRGVSITENGLMYRIEYELSGGSGSGYVEAEYLAYSDESLIGWLEEYGYESTSDGQLSASGYADVLQFPAGYQAALNSIKSRHSNWTFVPLRTGLDFNSAVNSEMGDKSWIYINSTNTAKGYVGNKTNQANWAYATRAGVEYYMDPRNFLSEDYIFQFEQLTYNPSYHTIDAIQSFLNGTFMRGVLPDNTAMTYAQAFYQIGASQGVSPIHLASRVYQEQGAGTSPLISGTYAGYQGYYNYFNVGATGSTTADVIRNGLAYAVSKGWNTRYKSLSGGASTIGNGYIKKGQDTSYLQKFNVNPGATNAVYTHQYMQNIQAPASESTTTRNMYAQVGALSSPFVFKIPVFENMPGFTLDKSQVTMNVGDTVVLNGYVNGTSIAAGNVSWSTSNSGIATVYGGQVSAIAPGEATITASYDGSTYLCRITVKNPLKSISLNITEDTMRRPDTIVTDLTPLSTTDRKYNHDNVQLNVSYIPSNTTDITGATFVSSNTRVATVDANGLVKAVGTGSAVITVRAKANAYITAQCNITVIAPIYEIKLTDPSGDNELLLGQNKTLVLEYWPKDTTSSTLAEWSSSAGSIADVNNGTVTGKSRGNAVITAKLNGYSATYNISIVSCTLKIMKNNDTEYKRMTVPYGENIYDKLPNVSELPAVTGADFVGWYTGPDGTGRMITSDTLMSEKEVAAYPYYESSGKGFYVVPVGDQVYTGSAIRPEIKVYDSVSYEDGNELKELVLNQDYTAIYMNNILVNTANRVSPSIVIIGRGNYTGRETVYFNIVPKNINDTDISVADVTVSYNGWTQKSQPVVTRNGVRLYAVRDYILGYPQTGTGAYTAAGTYPITLTGTGGYYGTKTIYETITPCVLLNSGYVAAYGIPVQKYTGSPIEPDVNMYYRGVKLVKSTNGTDGDYTISYQNNTNAGVATATVTAVSGSQFYGSRTLNFNIIGTPIGYATVNGLETKTYSCNEQDLYQEFSSDPNSGKAYLKYQDRILVPSTDGVTGDYTVSYSNLQRAGIGYVTFTGINGFTGSVIRTFRILQYNIKEDIEGNKGRISMSYHTQDDPDHEIEIDSIEEISCQYMEGGAAPVLSLYDNSGGTKKKLANTDFVAAYSNFNNVTTDTTPTYGLPKITVVPIGSYTGTFNGTCTVRTSDFDESKITMTADDRMYYNLINLYKSNPILKDKNGRTLINGLDYNNIKYYYSGFPEGVNSYSVRQFGNITDVRNIGDEVGAKDIPDAGTTIKVSVTGIKKYNGDTLSTEYRIVKSLLNYAAFRVANKEYYNGRPVTLKPEDITYSKIGINELQYGVDYCIDESSYTNNVNVGWGSVIIRPAPGSAYGGSIKVNFYIKSKAVSWWRNVLNNL